MKRKFIIFGGGPGTGKGTQAAAIANSYGYVHISTGDLCREEIIDQTPVGKEIADTIKAGELVADEMIFALLQKKIGACNTAQGFVFDGFPRTRAQAEWLMAFTQESNIEFITLIELILPDEQALVRLKGRAGTHSRPDDGEEIYRKRIAAYGEIHEIIMDYFTEHQLNVIEIDSEPPIEEVTQAIKNCLKEHMPAEA